MKVTEVRVLRVAACDVGGEPVVLRERHGVVIPVVGQEHARTWYTAAPSHAPIRANVVMQRLPLSEDKR